MENRNSFLQPRPFLLLTLSLIITIAAASVDGSDDGAFSRPPARNVLITPHARAESEPQQVHVSLAGEDHVRVTWITDDKHVSSVVEYGTTEAGPAGKYEATASGEHTKYRYFLYTSGTIHHVRIGPAHQGEGESMRSEMEELLYDNRVDVVFAGHVHAYERFVSFLFLFFIFSFSSARFLVQLFCYVLNYVGDMWCRRGYTITKRIRVGRCT
ncbi:unnamed protein product [Linum tenue]|uniref:Purple acid phosphatase N-terminal domain-containing protein n=1 Tax=Linum tenue TaxID=586396 RepID=A0AAV0KNB2_9ROSI|nr:unnamed protein product [Linum tenue]